MSAGSLGNPLAPIRDTMYYDRATGRTGSARRAMTPLPESGGGGDYNPYTGINAENTAKSAAGNYAGQAFEGWFSGLSDTDKQQFAGKPTGTGTFRADLGPPIGYTGKGVSTYKVANESGPQDPAVTIEANARAHYMQHILPNDEQYKNLQGKAAQATMARAQMTPLPEYQAGQAQIARTEAGTGAIDAGTDRVRQMTPVLATAGDLANAAQQQQNDRYGRMTPLAVDEEQNKVQGGKIANDQAGQMIPSNIAKNQAQATVIQRQGDENFIPKAEHDKVVKQNQDLQGRLSQFELRLAQLEKPGKAAPGLAPPGAQQDGTPASPAAAPAPAPAPTPAAGASLQRQTNPQTGLPLAAKGEALTDPQLATAFLRAANGDRNRARQLAQQHGWSF